jgi:hypothetical protein
MACCLARPSAHAVMPLPTCAVIGADGPLTNRDVHVGDGAHVRAVQRMYGVRLVGWRAAIHRPSSRATRRVALFLKIAPDYLPKQSISGGPPYAIQLPTTPFDTVVALNGRLQKVRRDLIAC